MSVFQIQSLALNNKCVVATFIRVTNNRKAAFTLRLHDDN